MSVRKKTPPRKATPINKSKPKARTNPTFQPNKNYQWQPTDEFILTGVEFDHLYKTSREAALNPVGATAQAYTVQFEILQRLFTKGVEAGVIKEKDIPSSADTQN